MYNLTKKSHEEMCRLFFTMVKKIQKLYSSNVFYQPKTKITTNKMP